MPAPGFDVPLLIQLPVGSSTDAEGFGTEQFDLGETVIGAAAMATFAEAQVAAANGMVLDAVALVPHHTVQVVAGARITVPDTLPEPLSGRYWVSAVRVTPLHLRCEMRRLTTSEV